MRDVRTFLVVGGVVALVAVGALAASLAGGGGDDSANGSVPVDDVGAAHRGRGSWSTTAPPRRPRCRASCAWTSSATGG